MKIAAFIGIPLSEFYKMTPKEFHIYVEGFNERKKNKLELEQKVLIYQAYLISRWVWAKDVPIEKTLNELGANKEKKEVMTDEQMLRQVMVLNAMFGGEVKTCNS